MVCDKIEPVLQVGADQFVVPVESVLKTFGSKIEMFLDTTSRTDTYTKYVIMRPKDSTMALIEYCYTGQLHIPKSVCKGEFLTELRFWGLKSRLLEACCYHKLCAFLKDQKMLKGFENMYMESENCGAGHSGNGNAKERIWGIVNCDRKSTCSKVYFYVSTTFVLLMITVLALTSMSDVKDNEQHPDGNSSGTSDLLPSTNQLNITGFSNMSANCGTVTPMPLRYTPTIIRVNCVACSLLTGGSRGMSPSNKSKKLEVENTYIHLHLPKCCKTNIVQSTVIPFSEILDHTTEYKDVYDLDITPIPDYTQDLYDLDKPPKPNFNDYGNDSSMNQTTKLNGTRYFATNVTPHSASSEIYSDATSPGANISKMALKNITNNENIFKSSVKDWTTTFLTNSFSNSKKKLSSFTSARELASNADFENVLCHYMEHVITAFFTVEFVLRLITCPNKKEFLSGVLNLLDLILLLDSFGRILLDLRSDLMETMTVVYDLLLYLQMFRVFRLFRTIEHIKAFKVLRYSLVTGMKDICVLVMYVMVTMCIFSNFIYFVENKSDFPSIPAAWWWSIVTMTTVGYGDVVPKTVFGKLIGCICALSGVVLFSLIIPVFVSTFLTAYEYAKGCQDGEEGCRDGEDGKDSRRIGTLNSNENKQITRVLNVDIMCKEQLHNPNEHPILLRKTETMETTQF
ncbi:potassium voltage-gated channel protein Shaw-like [Pecten maximus]|uniref:potassium voltage-gated channel protein Shaw-like n=1 Tax=Pecten maximus TaxID=6579 RepID=UPI00145886DE|nr:potassium voltage-gated channel protein Shaw-like [Pecten maximus]